MLGGISAHLSGTFDWSRCWRVGHKDPRKVFRT
jgi:hypothetical protein